MSYNDHYWKIQKYKRNFENLMKVARYKQVKEENFLDLLVFIVNYFTSHNTGCYMSSDLENLLLSFSNQIKIDLSDIKYKKNSILHVLTQGYNTGGHTRVVEKWIESAPTTQKHSVLQTDCLNENLFNLRKNVLQKKGNFLKLRKNLSIENKVKLLRKISMKYEVIILHIHMNDVIPILAFGVKDFKRPVLFFNHASHLPWIGACISDLVLDIEYNDFVTKNYRRVNNSFFLGIPTSKIISNKKSPDKIKKDLCIPNNKKIIVTSGSKQKYRQISGRHFFSVINEILDDNSICIVIGVKECDVCNIKDYSAFKHILFLGNIPHDAGYLDYLKIADLYLDSYPFCGGTACIEALLSGVPVLSLKSVYPQFDYLKKTEGYCNSEYDLIFKAKKILSDKIFYEKIYLEEKKSFELLNSIEAWNNRLCNLNKLIPNYHQPQFISKRTCYYINDLAVLGNVVLNEKFLRLKNIILFSKKDIAEIPKYGEPIKKYGYPYFFEIIVFKKKIHKTVTIRLLNLTIYARTIEF